MVKMVTPITIFLSCIITFGLMISTDKITNHYIHKHREYYIAIASSGYIIYSISVLSLWLWGYDIVYKIIGG